VIPPNPRSGEPSCSTDNGVFIGNRAVLLPDPNGLFGRRCRGLYTCEAVRPRGGGASTSQGRPYAIFQRALSRRNVLDAVAAARELPQLSLLDALELTLLIARKDPHRHQRVAARWLLRFLEEDPDATIEEAGIAAACLAGLGGAGYREAAQTLRALAERAGSRRRSGTIGS
jgi:hypothetical protein